MKKLFFRAFISIISIIFIIIFIVTFSLALFYRNATNDWIKSSFHSFCNNVAIEVSKSPDNLNFDDFIEISDKVALSDSRISGLLFRDVNENLVFSIGKTRQDKPLAQRALQEKDIHITSLEKGEDIDPSLFKSVEVKAPLYFLEIKDNEVRLNIFDNPMFTNRLVELPPHLDESSISGSLIVLIDDSYIFSTDVLSYTPSTYKINRILVQQIVSGIIYSLMIAIVFSLFLSFIYSTNNKKYVDSIRNSLSQLSEGKENVELPNSTIDEHKQIIESIKSLDEVLSLNRKGRKAWLNSITHDLYTPVTSIQILLDGIEDGVFPLSMDVIKQIKNEHNDLLNRIQRVVTYSSLQSPDKQIQILNVDVKELISKLIQENETYQRVNFVMKSPIIYCDYPTMKMALMELIDNALNSSKEIVDVFIFDNKIVVENYGTLKNDVAFFEPWERGDKSRTQGGNGLGLPIVSQIIRLHNGVASIEQREDKVKVLLKWNIPLELIKK